MKHSVKKVKLTFKLNGKHEHFEVYPMLRLIDLLREEAGLTATKEGCGEGECGACAVLLNGKLINSCLVPAIQMEGCEVVTAESVADDKTMDKVKDSFLKHGGTQCGYCTPGMVLAATNLLHRYPKPTKEQIKTGLAGNLCRCTGYTRIFESVVKACDKS